MSVIENNLPLAGLHVVDFTSMISGPFCSRLLCDAGASVVKVEQPDGDPLRRLTVSGASVDPDIGSPLYQYLNSGKSSLVADLRSEAGREVALDAVRRCDLVLEDFDDDLIADSGLDFRVLRDTNPTAAVVSISAWGRSSGIDQPASDLTLQAISGSMFTRGDPAMPPPPIGGEAVSWVSGLYASLSALAALARHDLSGSGEHVDVSQAQCFAHANLVWPDGVWGDDPENPGSVKRKRLFPSLFHCSDGQLAIMTLTGQQWYDFACLVGHPEWTDDPSTFLAEARSERDDLREAGAAWAAALTVAEATELATAFRLPTTPIMNGQTLPLADHYISNGYFVASPTGFVQPASPLRVSGIERQPVRESVARGAGGHTEIDSWQVKESSPPSGRTRDADVLPFEGLRIADFTAFYAPSAVGQFFAALGADVIHIESPRRIDGFRTMYTHRPMDQPLWWETSVRWFQSNVGKRSLTLDMDSEPGREIAARLIATCDVVTDGFTPRVMGRWGLSYERLREIRSDIIVMRMSSFGSSGEWSDHAGFAPTIEAATGFSWLTGYPEGEPVHPGGLADALGAVNSATCLALALRHRAHSGEGQLIETPMIGVGLAMNAEQVVEFSTHDVIMERLGSRSSWHAPQGVYPSADGKGAWLALSVGTVQQWRALRALLQSDDLLSDSALLTVSGRRAAHDLLDERISSWSARHRLEEACKLLHDSGIPAARVVTNERHEAREMRAQGFIETITHPHVGCYEQMTWPARFSQWQGPWFSGRAPLLGEHNEEILAELGVSPDEMEKLRTQQVIGNEPIFQ